MLEYLTGIMEDAQDIGWASAKGADAVILCKMEEGKVKWLMSDKLDRLRPAHAQKINVKVNGNTSNGQTNKLKDESQGVLTNTFRQVNTHIKWTIQAMGSCTVISALTVTVQVSIFHIP